MPVLQVAPMHRARYVAALGLVALAFANPATHAQPVELSPTPSAVASPVAIGTADLTMEIFLDRLMQAESGGRDTIANPRSTAVGAFQFIAPTFIDIARRHFASETASLAPAAVLALRTNRAFARRAAEAFTRDNALHLTAAGVSPTWPHLRLAFFAGADGAVRIIKSTPDTPVRVILGPSIVAANPFLANYTAHDLVARAANDLKVSSVASGGPIIDSAMLTGRRQKAAAIPVFCDLGQPSCRRWLALAQRRQSKNTVLVRKPIRRPLPS
jgi:hypothetical protein